MSHPDTKVLVAPDRDLSALSSPLPKVFLAGSIDMGEAANWQARVVDELSALPVILFNPRRPDFDTALVQDITCTPFAEQVYWELDHLDAADIVIFCFDPAGKAPVTLLELGLHARGKKCLICCPPGYWRRGNVQIIAERFGAKLVDTLDELLAAARIEIIAHDI
ncbi:hypothetical protein CcrC1_gp251c [Caulobacter phage C1]|nr:hypothetical protein CcrC1_gp251c [Caulobacter phage C1]UTU08480.1 hypothetical protein CcrC2_gp252c [Caulobacter phage C2]UTU10113.1 hypothetical protein CcrRB23_gp251c [Caulobacter phage RB23]WGN97148.1 hypothetical protein [Bertelyvirus sp.]WGN97665.1 hypothetical protein [Bertelyvirus sp.]